MSTSNFATNDREVLIPPPNIQVVADRLYRITGFVTALWLESDERPLVFARYYHVRRVAWTANFLAQSRVASGDTVDLSEVHWFAWAHDLNRWPFAHNSEKGLFKQDEDIPRYFQENNIDVGPSRLADLKRIVSKNYEGLSKEAKIVLLADMVTGFIEDPLWAVTALDLLPSFVPASIVDYLCIGLDQPDVKKRVLELNLLFESTKTVEPFETQFDTIFQETTAKFLETRELAEFLPLGEPEFEHWRQKIKEEFMCKKLFVYNNEKISHGPRLRREIIEPLYKNIGMNASSIFTTIDEPQTLERAQELGLISEHNTSRYLPSLDYVTKHEPKMSFRRNVPKS